MSEKLYDICYAGGKYMDPATGQEKTRYENVGAVMNGEYGPFIVINRALNLAGIPTADPNRSSIILKLFKNEPQQQDPAANNPANSPQTMQQQSGAPVFNPNPPQNNGAGVANGEIPF